MANIEVKKPHRVRHQFRQHYPFSCAEVWPQLCPVAEQHWVPGWQPTAIYSECGVVEQECVFTTASDDQDAIWVVSDYQAQSWSVMMIKIVPAQTVTKISIQLGSEGAGCYADIAYSHTSLSRRGEQVLQQFTADHYVQFMLDWQQHLTHYLATQKSKTS